MNRLTRSAVALTATALAASLALAGCTAQGSTLADDYRDHAGQGYVSGDGTVRTIAPADREAAVEFSGTTDAGDDVSSADYAGQVVVLNFWYASCPPCRTEAPDLAKLATEFEGQDVTFLGVNVQDSGPTAQTFATKFGIPYPSILDAGDNDVQLAFAGEVPPNAVPTTLVIDKQGRVAARFSGLITSPSVVSDVVDDALAETP